MSVSERITTDKNESSFTREYEPFVAHSLRDLQWQLQKIDLFLGNALGAPRLIWAALPRHTRGDILRLLTTHFMPLLQSGYLITLCAIPLSFSASHRQKC